MSNDQQARALGRSNAHFAHPRGGDLFSRLDRYNGWIGDRLEAGYWPYARTLETPPGPVASIAYAGHPGAPGANLAVQDYLSLSTHPSIREAAVRAVRDFGVHSAGSAMLLGNNPLSLRLEQVIAEFLKMRDVLLFPTGWAAGYGAVKGLIRTEDHIVLDALAHACLQEGAAAATRNIHRYKHLDVQQARSILSDIRARDADNAVLVIAEGLYSMDSDTPDLLALQTACREFGAKLLVDVAHDLGALGPGGLGQLGLQGVLGDVDIVMGAFSKTFASNGGFIATNDPRVKPYLRWFANPHTFSNALSPIQCAVVAEAFRIIQTPEGDELRDRLLEGARTFRAKLGEAGLEVLGSPSAIVPVLIGREDVARVASRNVAALGVFTNLVEFPAVGLGAARFRCQLMSAHDADLLRASAESIAVAIGQARDEVGAYRSQVSADLALQE